MTTYNGPLVSDVPLLVAERRVAGREAECKFRSPRFKIEGVSMAASHIARTAILQDVLVCNRTPLTFACSMFCCS